MDTPQKQVLSVIGLGYVGLTTALGFGLRGHKILGVDSDADKVAKVSRRISPIHEEGLSEALQKVDLAVSTDYRGILASDITFLCINTPCLRDGSIDVEPLERLSRQLAALLNQKGSYHLVAVRSTFAPGTTERAILPSLGKLPNVGVCVNPEFLREGKALCDFMNPSRIVIGEADKRAGDVLYQLYQGFGRPIVRKGIRAAEMIKCASNAFLATKISFINEIGNLCKHLGIDVYDVVEGMSYDERIGDKFLDAGIGFGGSCLCKDTRLLTSKASTNGYYPQLLHGILAVNDNQPLRMIELLKRHLPLPGKTIGLLGLAFKPGTDDVRESRAIIIAEALLREKAKVRAYDPCAMPNFRRLFPQIEYVGPDEALKSDAILIVTEWEEFEKLDYRGKIVVDGRRVSKAREARLYEGICW